MTLSVEKAFVVPLQRLGIATPIPTRTISSRLRAPSILCIGNDPSLLQTRQLLLAANGYGVSSCSATHVLDMRLPSGLDRVVICYSVEGEQLDQVLARLERRIPRESILLTEPFDGSRSLPEGYSVTASERPEQLLRYLRHWIETPTATSST